MMSSKVKVESEMIRASINKQKSNNMLDIHVTTLNCGAQMPESSDELLPLFETKSDFEPDIYVIGLQEIVTLNAKNCLKMDTKKVD
jgi:hypothetical protein